MNKNVMRLALMLVMSIKATSGLAAKWYVNDGASTGDVFTTAIGNNGNAGNSPGAPKLTISAAFALAADGDSILIDAGTYTQNGNFNITITQNNLTVLGAGQTKTIFQETPGFSGFLFEVNGNNVVIRDIQATGFQYYGAVYVTSNSNTDSTRVTFSGSYFANNGAFVPFSATGGGAFAITTGGGMLPAVVTIDDCRFSTNNADLDGGTIMVKGRSRLVCTNSTFSCGDVTDLTTTDGGGIYFDDSYGSIDNCVFDNNKAGRNGGAIYIDNTTAQLAISITNSYFYSSIAATRGSAICLRRGVDLYLSNNLLYENQVTDGNFSISGTISMNDTGGNSTITMINCTLANNTAPGAGDSGGLAVEAAGAGKVSVQNSILYGNSNKDIDDVGGDVSVSNSIVDAAGGATFTNAGGNSTSDPLFSNPASDDFTLQNPGSPAIDAGNMTGAPLSDVTGAARTGNPDMGAYESGSFAISLVSVCGGLPACATPAPTGAGNQSYCSSDPHQIQDLQVTGTNVLWYDAPGGNLLNSTDVLADGITYYATQTIGCESLGTLAVLVSINNPAAPADPGAQSFCAINNPTLADLLPNTADILWYAAASGGAALPSNTALTDATSYFASQTVSGCESTTRRQVDVTVNDPAAPADPGTQSFCAINNPTLADLLPNTADILWYAAASGGAALPSNTALADATSYFATQTVSGCESDTRRQVDVTIADPAAPADPGAQSFCAINNPTLADLLPNTADILWYAAASGGAALPSNTALADATSYFATQTVAGCESDTRRQVDVTIADPAAPADPGAQSFCAINNPTLADLLPNTADILWYAAASGGAALPSNTALADATSYFATQTVAGCESDTRRQVDVTIADPAAPADPGAQSFCAINNPTLADLLPNTADILWYAAASGGAALPSNTALTDATSYFATQTVAGCESDTRRQVDVTVNDPAAPADPGAQSFCAINNPTLADLLPNTADILWYAATSGGAALPSNTPLTDATSYFATQTVAGCESDTRRQVDVTVNDPAAPADPGAQTFCAVQHATIADLNPSGASITWYDAASGGNVLTGATALTTATSYFATQTVAGCESDTRLQVDVTITDPGTPTGANNQSFCTIDAPTLSDITVVGAGIQWYDAPTGGTLLPNSTLLQDGSTYYATQTLGCESDVRLDVTVALADPAAPGGSPTMSFCAIDLPTVNDLSATGTAIQWYASNSGGSPLSTSTPLVDGTSYFASQTTGTPACESTARFEVLVTVNDPSSPTGASAQSFCAINNPTIADLNVTGTSVQWYDAAINGNVLAASTPLTTGTSYFATQTVGVCESDQRLQVDVTVDDPAAPTGSATQSFCAIDVPTVADLSATGSTIQWYDASSNGNLLNATDALVDGAAYFASQTIGSCESDQRLQVQVTINDPAMPTGSGSQSFCSTQQNTIADLQATGTGIQWYDQATGGNLLAATTALTDGATYFASQTVGGCESDQRLPVTVSFTVIAAPTGEDTLHFCLEANATVQDLTATGSALLWYDENSSTTPLSTTDLLINDSVYYASQTVGGCESATRLAVLAHVYGVTAELLSSTNPTCGERNGVLAANAVNAVEPVVYAWNNGENTAQINNAGTDVMILTITDANGCVADLSRQLNCEIGDIPEIITPGGNGMNETWVLGISAYYPEATVSIFNRWGNEVYKAAPYKDDWDGKANTGTHFGNGYLPSGTYYYIIDLKNGEKPLSGYLELVK